MAIPGRPGGWPLLVLPLLLALILMGLPGGADAGQGAWSQLDLAGLQVNVVATDPSDPNVLFAGTAGQGIYRSLDGGQNWAQFNTGLGNLTVNDILVDPTNTGNLLAGTGRGPLVGEPSAGIYRSTDRGSTWTWVQPAGAILALALTPQSPNVMYAAGGPPVFKSVDGGATWTESFRPGTDFVNVDLRGISVDPADPSILLAAGNTEGGQGQVFRSTNAGTTWDRVLAGQPALLDLRFVQDLRAGALAFLGGLNGVFRSSDTGLNWQRVGQSLGDLEARRIDPNPLNGNEVAIATNRGVFRSVDTGNSWSQLDSSLGNQDVREVTYNRANPQTLYAGTANGAWAFTLVAPAGQQPSPSIAVAPSTAAPGQNVRVRASGITAENQIGATFCLGVLGPGRNVELGLSPAFRVRIGTLTIGPDGAGEADAALPANLVGGTYDLIIGGCPVQPGLAPLASLARTTLTVVGPSPTIWYFAEGSTQPPFDTWFLVQNPTGEPAAVSFTFSFESGPDLTRTFTVGPNSRFSLFANQLFPNTAFSTRVSSDKPIFAERSMFVDFEGDVVPGISGPSNVWLFAEGSTQEPFHTWLLLQNPTVQVATATITYRLENEASVAQTVSLPPTSRTSIFVNQALPNRAFSARVESSLPIVAERAMYRFPGNAATADVGVTAPSRTWYFADGHNVFFRNQPADTWLLLQNANSFPVAATVTFFSSEGVVRDFQMSLSPSSRQSLYVNQVFNQPAYGIRVAASAEIIAERSVFIASPTTGGEPRGAMATVGATELGTTWTFAEGSTAPPFSENLVVLNPHDQEMAVRFEFMLENGQVVARDITVGPRRRTEVDVNALVPGGGVSARVTTSLPSVVERVMFWIKGGNMGAHDAMGTRL